MCVQLKLLLLVPGGGGSPWAVGVSRQSCALEEGTGYKTAALFGHSEAWLNTVCH